MKPTWKEIDAQRPKGLSRAEMCRRAGIAESTIIKGIAAGSTPIRATRERVEGVLAAERDQTMASIRRGVERGL